jgi:phosphotransferase system IIB component
MTAVKNFDVSHDMYAISKDGGKYSLRLGNWTTAGWHWDGDKSDLGGFFVRLANSGVTDDFLADMKSNGVSFADVKADTVASVKSGNGVYELTGDNVQWHFGQETIDMEALIDEYVEQTGKTREEIEGIAYDINLSDYDDFVKSNAFKEAKAELLGIVESADSFDALMGNLSSSKLKEKMIYSVMDWQTEKFHEEMGVRLGKK